MNLKIPSNFFSLIKKLIFPNNSQKITEKSQKNVSYKLEKAKFFALLKSQILDFLKKPSGNSGHNFVIA